MALNQNPVLKYWGQDSANVQALTQTDIGNGIIFQSDEVSSQVNAAIQNAWQAIQFLQHTGAFYNSLIPYTNPDIVSLLTYNNGIYGINAYVRNTSNPGSTTNNPPLTGASIATVNGINVYTGGTTNSDWQIIKDFDVYNLGAKFPYVDLTGDIDEQMIANPGIIVKIRDVLGTAATGANFIADILNNSAVVKKSGDTYTLPSVTATLNEKTDSDTNVSALAGKILALRINQIGSTIPGQDIRVQVWIART